MKPESLQSELHAKLNSNDLYVRWFDAETSFIWPKNGGWMATPVGQKRAPALDEFWPAEAEASSYSQVLFQLPAPPDISWDKSGISLEDVVTFLGYKRIESTSGNVELLTAWRVERKTERPLKIFVHALGTEGQILGQWDGLHVEPTYWAAGDVFVQFHTFSTTASDEWTALTTGMYDGETMVRLSTPILLEE